MQQSLQNLVAQSYGLGDFSFRPFGEGLIHETFLVESKIGKFVLQGFNDQVFQYPDRIASNLAQLKAEIDVDRLPYELPLPKLTEAGESLFDEDGKLYRLFDFVEGVTVQETSDPKLAFLAGKAYGEFAKATATFDMRLFQETIPDFHRLDLRYERLQMVAGAKASWTEEESDILRFYLCQNPLIENYKAQTKNLPLRLTHNDTKINNLIFSQNLKQVAALIDLDTVMPGYLLYDFGDLVRTVACSRSEINTQWSDIQLDLSIFEALLEGYFEGVLPTVSAVELQSLLIGGEIMTCMMGLRFFTDHLQGNIYYKVDYPEQNLHRAKNQMILLRDQQEKRSQLQLIWEKTTLSRQ